MEFIGFVNLRSLINFLTLAVLTDAKILLNGQSLTILIKVSRYSFSEPYLQFAISLLAAFRDSN